MTRIHRSATIDATPDAIWDYLAEPSHWPQWDPDIAEIEASEPGFTDGQTWTVRMHQPMQATVAFANIERGRHLDWHVSALGGLLRSEATFRLEPGSDAATTTFHYEFELAGLLGGVLQRLRGGTVVGAVEEGLANIASATSAGS